MNYLKVYCNLIRKAENRTPPKGYVEKHHIFPVSIYGKNNKVVILTGREHYIAHVLLEKIFIKRYGLSDQRTYKMIWAHMCMKRDNILDYLNSYLYESSKKKLSILTSENHWNKKITDNEIVKAIKWYWTRKNNFKDISIKNLSLYFNISEVIISNITTNRSWKHIIIDDKYQLPKRFLYIPLEIRLKTKNRNSKMVQLSLLD